ncbi:MAG: hypothetical protein IKN38_01320 [Clostridia bacterium]|nr:hypothetical protein [Clostridia bacterium]
MRSLKIISVTLVLLAISFCVPFGSFAEGEPVTFYYNNGQVEVTFEDPTDISYEKMQFIADKLAGVGLQSPGGDSIMLNPECAAGNHLIDHKTVSRVAHNVYTTSPKCVRNTYYVTYCKRSNCDYYVEILTNSERILCH